MKKLYTDLRPMLAGLRTAADVVGSTLGPDGRNVFIDDPMDKKITNDGARIAYFTELEDKLENAGAWVVKNACAKTNDNVGDGTTTTAVLLKSILDEGLKRPESPAIVRVSLGDAVKEAVKMLKEKANPVTLKDVKDVALVAGENEELAEIIHEIYQKLGEKTFISLENSKTYSTYYEIVEGLEVRAGYLSPYFINNQKKQTAEYEEMPVFVTDKKMTNVNHLGAVMQKLREADISQCAFFVGEIDDRVLATLAGWKFAGIFNGLVVKVFKDEMADIAGATGATVIGDGSGISFEKVKLEHLGKAKRLTADRNSTLIIANSALAKIRATELQAEAENEDNSVLKGLLEERAARLNGQVAILYIGANNDLARAYLRDKAEDAVKAVPAALAEGLVEGAGHAWLEVAKELPNDTIGQQILKRALRAPYKKILENKGIEEETEKVSIQDPVKVERVALENAAEAAGIMITTKYAIIDVQERAGRLTAGADYNPLQ
ncbi:MAG: hypothetical protein KGJ90_06505 [Patescibacteria group bacterium]|nr:hypothetical protein [Patescibacteria group bacterium]